MADGKNTVIKLITELWKYQYTDYKTDTPTAKGERKNDSGGEGGKEHVSNCLVLLPQKHIFHAKSSVSDIICEVFEDFFWMKSNI